MIATIAGNMVTTREQCCRALSPIWFSVSHKNCTRSEMFCWFCLHLMSWKYSSANQWGVNAGLLLTCGDSEWLGCWGGFLLSCDVKWAKAGLCVEAAMFCTLLANFRKCCIGRCMFCEITVSYCLECTYCNAEGAANNPVRFALCLSCLHCSRCSLKVSNFNWSPFHSVSGRQEWVYVGQHASLFKLALCKIVHYMHLHFARHRPTSSLSYSVQLAAF